MRINIYVVVCAQRVDERTEFYVQRSCSEHKYAGVCTTHDIGDALDAARRRRSDNLGGFGDAVDARSSFENASNAIL